jgi:hypothetical protein
MRTVIFRAYVKWLIALGKTPRSQVSIKVIADCERTGTLAGSSGKRSRAGAGDDLAVACGSKDCSGDVVGSARYDSRGSINGA